jgi:hypothetical protein
MKMQQVDPKEMPKLYALIGLAVLLFGWVLYSNLGGGGSTSAKSKNANSKTADKTSASANEKPGTQVASNEAVAGALPFDPALVSYPSAGADPFRPAVGGVVIPPRKIPSPAPVRPQQLPNIGNFAKPSAPVKSLPKSLDDLLNQSKGKVKPVVVTPNPDVLVTGVVLGNPEGANPRDVAILRKQGSDERLFVTIGDSVGNGFRVTAISAEGVELQAGNRRVTLKIGQSGENTRAK